jgi:hypothetical protein
MLKLKIALATLFIGSTLLAVPAKAQYASSPQARDLLATLQDAHSMTKVGISWLEYGKVARDIQIKLDRFLRAPGASQHPAGAQLKDAAENFVEAHSDSPRYWEPQFRWMMGGMHLEDAEKCVASKIGCRSIDENSR